MSIKSAANGFRSAALRNSVGYLDAGTALRDP